MYFCVAGGDGCVTLCLLGSHNVLNLWTDLEESGTDFSIFSIFGDSLFLFVFDKSVGRSC
jgi:hypothetical protein